MVNEGSNDIIERDHAAVAPTIYRYTDIVFTRGDGVYLYDPEGREYLDFVSGIATMNVGHGHPEVVEAICQALSWFTYPYSLSFMNDVVFIL